MKGIKIVSPLLLIVLLLIVGCKQKPVATTQGAAVKYTCPMHHQIVEDQPGFCPICGMTLVKKSGQASESAGIDLNTVLQPVNSTVISSINTIIPLQKDVPVNINADGFIDYDARTFNNIAARFAGRIEKLYIKYSFEEIHKGQRLFDIYSPDMVSAQQDLIYLKEHTPEETELIRAAEQKLLLLGLSQGQLSQVEKSHKAFYSLPVFSPYDGHVHDRSHSQNVVMPETNADQAYATNMPLSIKEGMYIEQGQILFNVVDAHRLWAIIKIKNTDLADLKLHQPVNMTMPDMPGMILDGRVDFIEPFLQNGDKATLIRVYLHNMDHDLKVNSLLKAEINTGTKSGVWIPRAALTDLGQHKIVWLKQDGLFKVQPVETGLINGDFVLISKGLAVQDTIAANAQYLTDSESFIKTKAHE